MSSNFSDLEPNVKVAIFEITNLTILKSESSHFLLLFDHSLKKNFMMGSGTCTLLNLFEPF